jgi:UDP-N-acetylenolpyruvoylglucosamine reductase
MTTGGFDAERFEIELGQAGQALIALAQGPGQVAADVLGEGFGRAAAEIEQALVRAARTGELSFERLFRDILEQLARLAAQAVIEQAGLGGGAGGGAGLAGGALNLTVNMGAGAGTGTGGLPGGAATSRAQVAQAVLVALRAGGRFT